MNTWYDYGGPSAGPHDPVWKDNELTEEDWSSAKEHFDRVRQQYQDLEGTPGANTTFALRIVFRPLAIRYNRGERSRKLYDEMMNVE